MLVNVAPMKILYLCDEYPPGPHGGIGTAVQLVAREMVSLGHQVEVAGLYSPGYGQADREIDQGVGVHRFREAIDQPVFRYRDHLGVRVLHRLLKGSGIRHLSIRKSMKAYQAKLDALIQEKRIDLVVVPDYQDYMRFCIRPLPLLRFGVPRLVVLHGSKTFLARMAGTRESPAVRHMETEWVSQAQGIIAVSQFVESMSRRYFEWPDSLPTRVIPNGLVLRELQEGKAGGRDPNRVVFAGTLVESKGIYSLVEAWNRVAALRPLARLDIYGKGPISKIRALIRPEHRSSVRFWGHVGRRELSRAYEGASLGVFPSYLETFGMAALEAMHAGLAVIFTERTAGPELIEDGVDGLLADPDNPESLAEKMMDLLDFPEKAREMGDRARIKVHRQYGIARIATAHLEFYNRILSQDA